MTIPPIMRVSSSGDGESTQKPECTRASGFLCLGEDKFMREMCGTGRDKGSLDKQVGDEKIRGRTELLRSVAALSEKQFSL